MRYTNKDGRVVVDHGLGARALGVPLFTSPLFSSQPSTSPGTVTPSFVEIAEVPIPTGPIAATSDYDRFAADCRASKGKLSSPKQNPDKTVSVTCKTPMVSTTATFTPGGSRTYNPDYDPFAP